MKLYFFPVAPNPTKVRLYLAEKAAAGSPIELEPITVSLPQGQHSSPEHRARNPFGTLPVLELDDGSFLIESLAMIEYLEELHPDPPMIGASPRERARVRELERVAELRVMGAVARIVHATNSPLGMPASPEVAAQARSGLPAALAWLDQQLADDRPFLAGERPTIADCTLQAAFQFARFGKIEADIDPAHRNLARWDAAYREREPARSVLVI